MKRILKYLLSNDKSHSELIENILAGNNLDMLRNMSKMTWLFFYSFLEKLFRLKKVFITTGLLFSFVASFAQSSDIKVFLYERAIGKMTATQEQIMAKEYFFPERIYLSYIDTISNSITLQLRGLSQDKKWMNNTGSIVYYGLSDKKVKWSKKIAYQTNNLQQFGSTIILTGTLRSYRLNNENGKNLWKTKNIIYVVDPVANVGIGYKVENALGTNTLEGIDLKNGKTMWQRELNREYGWNDAFRIKDSVWMISAAGLHTINIYNGLGWKFHAVTGEKDYTATALANMAGIGLGLLTGTFMIATGYNLVADIVSNAYMDSTQIYFASKEKLTRLDRDNGKIIWDYRLPADWPSKSTIFANENYVFLVNYGYAYMGFRQLDYGTPFFAAFNKKNGEQIFFTTIHLQKNPILDFKIVNDHILLLFKDRIMKCSLIDGSIICEKTIDNEVSGELEGFIGNRVYIDATNSTLTNLVLSDISKKYVITNKNVLIFDVELNIVGEIDMNQLYSARMRIDDYYLIVTKDDKSFILNANNEKVAEIDIALKPVLIGNKIYSIHERSFYEIDLTNLIERK